MKPSATHQPRSPRTDADLFDRWRHDRDGDARDELVTRHLPLARRLASRYAPDGRELDDLTQVASVGLINAVSRFDPAQGCAFSTYAVPTILGELKRHFRDTGWSVRVGRRAQERAQAVAAAQRTLADRGAPVTVGALADLIGCDAEAVLDGLQASLVRNTVSLDAPAERGAGGEVRLPVAVGCGDPQLAGADDRATLDAAVMHLPRLERRVLRLRFAEDLSQRDIAARVGISQMHVSRLLRQALDRLRPVLDDSPQAA